MSRLARLVQLELLAVLRMREVHLFGVLPAALVVPVYAGLIVLVLSLFPLPALTLPTEDPGIAVPFESWQVERSDEPDGDGLAVLDWRLDGGTLHATVRSAEPPDGIEDHLERAVIADLDGRIEAAGGSAPRDRLPTRWQAHHERPFPVTAAVLHACVALGAYLGCFLIPSRTAEERLSGVLEAYAATSTPLLTLFTARWIVGTVLCSSIVVLPVLMVAAIVPADLWSPADLPFHLFPEGVAALGTYTAVHVLIGASAGSTRTSLGYGSSLTFVAMGAGVTGTLGSFEGWPLLGLGHDGSWAVLLWRTAGAVALAFVGLGIAALRLRGEHVLPPGHSDE